MESRFSKRLEILTNLATICFLLLMGGAFLKRQFFSSNDAVKGLDPQVGSLIGKIEGLDYGRTPSTLMVAISSHCRFCLDSMPFYREISKQHSQTKVRLVFIHPPADSDLKGILQHNDIADAILFPADFQGLKVQRTPAIILVDGAGGIQRTWIGKLRSTSEREIRNLLN